MRIFPPEIDTVQSAPALGAAPCTGETELTALPEESRAIDAMMKAYRCFLEAVQHHTPYPETLLAEFETAISQAHLAIGTLRFCHNLNTQYHQLGASQPKDLPQPLPELPGKKHPSPLAWKSEFEEKVGFRQYALPYQGVVNAMVEALENVIALDSCYPCQHASDTLIESITQCESVLNRLRLEAHMRI